LSTTVQFFRVSLSQTGLLEMFSRRSALSTEPLDASAPRRAQPPWTRVVGPARKLRSHERHAANARGLGGAPPTCFPHCWCATRMPTPHRSATRDVAVLGRARRPCRRPMLQPCYLGAQGSTPPPTASCSAKSLPAICLTQTRACRRPSMGTPSVRSVPRYTPVPTEHV
jgi:hypothetical protein